MTTATDAARDPFDLAPHEAREESVRNGVPVVDFPDATVATKPATSANDPFETGDLYDDDPDKLPFLGWLWRHHVPGDEFYPLAHLVLSGGPGDIWARKTTLVPAWVARDIAEFFATGRRGVTEQHLDLANRAIHAYRSSSDKVDELVAKRRRWSRNGNSQSAAHEVKNAQLEGFTDLGITPSIMEKRDPTVSEMVPKVDLDGDEVPDSFALVRVRCTHAMSGGFSCGRPAVPGSMLCTEHGGVPMAYTPDELREIYTGAKQRLIAATLMAVDATIDIVTNSTNDLARLKAAEIIFDRTGFVPGVEVHLPGQVRDGQVDKTPAQVVLERLQQLGIPVPVTEPAGPVVDTDGNESDVVEGEIVGGDS